MNILLRLFVVLMTLTTGVAGAQPKPVLLDVDPGTDDALAILLALSSPELSVEAITVVAGNVDVDTGLRNALQLVELAGRSDIPVARGAEAPMVGQLVTSTHVHGKTGLGNIKLPPPSTKPYAGGAVDLIVKKIEEHPGRLILIPVGPLTNIALALKLRPDLIADIKEIVLMGGSITGGNITPAAEFNIYNDPEAADMVFHSGVPIVMVGLDVTEKTVLKPKDMEGISKNASQANKLVWGLTDYHLTERGAAGLTMHDPLAVGVAIDPSFVHTESLHVGVETHGEKTRGETIAARKGFMLEFKEGHGVRTVVGRTELKPNTKVCVEVDADRFIRFFVQRVLTGSAKQE
jgi:pyrimidine-specific ribonucleoside hydrolase